MCLVFVQQNIFLAERNSLLGSKRLFCYANKTVVGAKNSFAYLTKTFSK